MAGFSGIEMCGCVGSETVDARKSLPKAILLTIGSLAIMYIGMCSAVCIISPYAISPNKTMTVIPGTMVQATAPSLAAFLGGPMVGGIVTAGVFLSIVSCGFSGMLAGARTSLSMAETGLFPKQFAELHPRTKVPQYALIFQALFMAGIGICSYILARTGIVADAYSFLGAACGFLYGLLAMLYGVCLLGLRYTDPDIPRPFRVGRSGNTLAWLLSIFCAIVFGAVAFGCTTPAQQLAGTVLLLAGIPVYAYYQFRRG
jgi:amino acid transporter